MNTMEQNNEKEQKILKPRILLRTLNNGYMLEVNDEGYLYFNAQSLLEGFLIHVGMGRPDEMTKEERQKMIQATLDGSIEKKLQVQVTEQLELIASLKHQVKEQRKEIKELNKELKKKYVSA